MDWAGLAASTRDDFHDERAVDCDFYFGVVKSNPGKALDVDCGTGRLLVPFVAKGIGVEGMDTPTDMPAECRRKIENIELQTNLYQGSMKSINLPSRYATIIVPGD